jgi:hypothetical protein
MSMTQYSGDTTIISDIGTTPEERGITTEEFKTLFDSGLTAFVTWFNATHKGEIDKLVVDSGTDYTTKRTRNIRFKATDDFTTDDLGNGEIGFVYTP